MIKVLILKEIRNHLLSFRFAAAVVVAAALMITSTWVLTTSHGEAVRSYQAFHAQHERQVGSYETGADTPLAALSMGGRIVDRPPPRLGFLISGVQSELPKSFWISGYDGPTPETNLVRNRLRELFDVVDLRFVVGVIFSLLALLLTYDAVNGERRDGTLRLTLANPVRVRDLLLAKWLGVNLLLALAFGLSFLVSLTIALLHPAVQPTGGDVARLVLLVLLSILYLSVFVSLGLLLSTLFREPHAAVAAGLLLWVVLIFVVPGAAPLVASMDGGTSGYVQSVSERQDDLGYDFRAIRQEHLDAGKDWQEANRLTNEFWSEVVEPQRARQAQRANEGFLNRRERRVEESRLWARLSPYGGFSFAATELAGAGLGEQLRFERNVERYRQRFQEFLRTQEEAGRHQEVEVSEVPGLDFQPAPVDEAWAPALPDVITLALLSLGLFAAAFLRMQRYDVR